LGGIFIYTINILLKSIILYFNNFILLRPGNLYVFLARHNELPEDDILNVEACRSMLFVIIVFDIIVQSLVTFICFKVFMNMQDLLFVTGVCLA
jgi:hypothetical protein